MQKSRSFKELLVWQMAHQAVLKIYRITSEFPKNEQYGLTSQFRRAAISIPANIAEGFGKATPKEKIQFYTYAQGSLEECKYYTFLSTELGYCSASELENDLETISKLLFAYSSKINQKLRNY